MVQKTVTLDASLTDAQRSEILNKHLSEGWRVVSTTGNIVILERATTNESAGSGKRILLD